MFHQLESLNHRRPTNGVKIECTAKITAKLIKWSYANFLTYQALIANNVSSNHIFGCEIISSFSSYPRHLKRKIWFNQLQSQFECSCRLRLVISFPSHWLSVKNDDIRSCLIVKIYGQLDAKLASQLVIDLQPLKVVAFGWVGMSDHSVFTKSLPIAKTHS